MNYDPPGSSAGLQPLLLPARVLDKDVHLRPQVVTSNSEPLLTSLVNTPQDIAAAYTKSSDSGLVRFHRSRGIRRSNIRHTISNPIPISVPAHAIECPPINSLINNDDPPSPRPPPPPPNTPEGDKAKGKAPVSGLRKEHSIAAIKRRHADALRSQPSLNFSEVQTDETLSLRDLILTDVEQPTPRKGEVRSFPFYSLKQI